MLTDRLIAYPGYLSFPRFLQIDTLCDLERNRGHDCLLGVHIKRNLRVYFCTYVTSKVPF